MCSSKDLVRRARRLSRLAAMLVLAVAASACAAKRLRTEVDLGLARADREVAAGCYRCLTEALHIYTSLAPREPAQQAALDQRLFRTSILLSLREKELGLPATSHLDRARGLTSRQGDAARAAGQVDLAAIVPWDPTGLPRDESERQRLFFSAAERITTKRAALAASPDVELDAYLDVTVACRRPPARGETASMTTQATRTPASVLVSFLTAACSSHLDGLRAVLAREPRFVEAQLFIGRHLAGIPRPGTRPPTGIPDRPTTREGRAALEAAYAAFPQSPAIAMDLATLSLGRNYRTAHRLFESVTSRVPTHHDAWFGSGTALSYLKRHEDAISAFTHVLELGRWHVGDAYYWRAWNRHQLKDLERAWADVEESKKTLYNTNVFALAGFIAYDRKVLDVARTNLEKALDLSSQNCAAAWYLGMVHTDESRWPGAASAFEHAAGCYRTDIVLARRQKAEAEASDHPAETKAALVAEAEETIREAERQVATASYNAAFAHVRGGDRVKARLLLERALQHDGMKARATELLAFLDK